MINLNKMTADAPPLLLPKPSKHTRELVSDPDTVRLNAFIEHYYDQVRSCKDKGVNVCDFCFGNPQEIASPELVSIFQRALIPKSPQYYAYRTNVDGPQDLLAKSAAKRYAFDELHPEDVFFTSGNFAGLAVALQLIVEPEDNVVYMEPGWFLYRCLIRNARATPKPVKMPLHAVGDDDAADMRAFLDAVDDNTKLIIFNSPHNPTGKVYSKAWMEQFAEKLMDISTRRGYPVYVLADEAYSDFVFDGGRHNSIAAIYPYTILVYTYNKLTLSPSQRVGYLILSPLMPNREEMRTAVLLLQMALAWCFPNAVMMESVPELETMRDNFDATTISRRRDRMCDILEKIGYEVLIKPKGTFYLLIKTPIEDDMKFNKLLGKRNIYVLHGDLFNTPGFFRICLTATDEMIERSVGGFRQAFEEAMQDGSQKRL